MVDLSKQEIRGVDQEGTLLFHNESVLQDKMHAALIGIPHQLRSVNVLPDDL